MWFLKHSVHAPGKACKISIPSFIPFLRVFSSPKPRFPFTVISRAIYWSAKAYVDTNDWAHGEGNTKWTTNEERNPKTPHWDPPALISSCHSHTNPDPVYIYYTTIHQLHIDRLLTTVWHFNVFFLSRRIKSPISEAGRSWCLAVGATRIFGCCGADGGWWWWLWNRVLLTYLC